MPKGPQGQKRPGDVIGAAIMVGRIATGEIDDAKPQLNSAAAEMGRRGGKARAKALSKAQRKAVATKAAKARWRKG